MQPISAGRFSFRFTTFVSCISSVCIHMFMQLSCYILFIYCYLHWLLVKSPKASCRFLYHYVTVGNVWLHVIWHPSLRTCWLFVMMVEVFCLLFLKKSNPTFRCWVIVFKYRRRSYRSYFNLGMVLIQAYKDVQSQSMTQQAFLTATPSCPHAPLGAWRTGLPSCQGTFTKGVCIWSNPKKVISKVNIHACTFLLKHVENVEWLFLVARCLCVLVGHCRVKHMWWFNFFAIAAWKNKAHVTASFPAT
jgi:hypothetical protein